MRASVIALFLGVILFTSFAAAQDDEQRAPEIERMVRDGLVEALGATLGGGRTTDDKHLLAQAQANKARRARDADARTRAFDVAAEKYRRWLAELEPAARRGGTLDAVKLAAGRVEYAGLILSGQAAGELGDYEITNGQRGDRKRLATLFKHAAGQYEQAAKDLAPVFDNLGACEEELLAAGLYDAVLQTKLDGKLNLGWTNYYRGLLDEKHEMRRRGFLAAAERLFAELVDSGQAGQMFYRCHLALGMAQRELGRHGEAERSIAQALSDDAAVVVRTQARYELARTQIASGKFDEARATLAPLVAKSPEDLSREDRPARFYINLAHVWEANSYLQEAATVSREARDSTAARKAILQKAQRCRETGLSKLKRLGRMGGPWPALAQIYIAASVNLKTPIRQLSTVELFYTAGVLMDAQRYRDAAERLEAAEARSEEDQELAGDVLFELGRCRYFLKDKRGAANAFSRMARGFRSHRQAPRAATFAYGLWGKLAERSEDPKDYLRLAVTLRNLLESFADHPQRAEALWLLPVALQLAGRYDEAADEFAKVPDYSAHWEEAQYRRAVCERKVVEAARVDLDAAQYKTRAKQAANVLEQYADAALERAAAALNPDTVRTWSAQARVAAAELLSSRDVGEPESALKVVESFETKYPGSELIGRVLSLRIRAYRGLRDFERASHILAQYLEAAPAEQIGGTLAALAQGMQEEVQRLLDDGQAEAARELAADSVATFEELEKWVRGDPSRSKNLDFVLAGRTRMLYLAGKLDEARAAVTALLEQNPKNGTYRHLHAQILTAGLGDDASPDQQRQVQDAWAVLLTDPAIRQRAPQRYWEARYHWLWLALRLGRAADVETAITQERIFRPDLGGPDWQPKFETLLREARVAQGKPPEPETQPATDAEPADEGPSR